MDFYYAMTNYHILCCLLHKMLMNDHDGVLYISSYLVNNQPKIVERIKESGIFQEVYRYEEVLFTKTEKKMNDEEIDREIERVCKIVDKTVGNKIKKAPNVYVCSDFYSIGFYLIVNHIPYHFFEDGCGVLSQKNLPLKAIINENPNRALIIQKLKAFGNNEYVIDRYGSLKDQLEGYYNPKDIDFCVKKLLKGLSSSQIKELLTIYDVKKIRMNRAKACLLLTMHYNEFMTREDQIKIYATFLDYFTHKGEQIIIKPHPADTIFNYEEIYPKVRVLNRYMPAELFPYCVERPFEKGITGWSTSIFSLKDIIKNIIKFDSRIDDTFYDFDKYYAIIQYLKAIKKEETIIPIHFIDVNDVQFMVLLKYHFKDYKKYYSFEEENENTIYIVDKMKEEYKDKKVISLKTDFSIGESLCIQKEYEKDKTTEFVGLHNIELIPFEMNFEQIYQKATVHIERVDKEQYPTLLYNALELQDQRATRGMKEKDEKIELLERSIMMKVEDLEKLHNSTSWRITKPLRKVVDIIRSMK